MMPSTPSQKRLCLGCGTDWYSEMFLSPEKVACPDCDVPLTPAPDRPSERLAVLLADLAAERPELRESARFN